MSTVQVIKRKKPILRKIDPPPPLTASGMVRVAVKPGVVLSERNVVFRPGETFLTTPERARQLQARVDIVREEVMPDNSMIGTNQFMTRG